MRCPSLAVTAIEEVIEPTFTYIQFLYFYILFSVWGLELAKHSTFESHGRLFFFPNDFRGVCVRVCMLQWSPGGKGAEGCGVVRAAKWAHGISSPKDGLKFKYFPA